MPNGSLLKQYQPKGVMKIIKFFDVAAKGICQKLLLASGLLNTTTPANWASVSSSHMLWVNFEITNTSCVVDLSL